MMNRKLKYRYELKYRISHHQFYTIWQRLKNRMRLDGDRKK
ncbi:hypothetical protein [Paenibacillus xanthanilyticus]|uniref:Uncharacterized protein n=1 Tax=Paenibacillus xanthanilyticus TaxID=1783531 RepID=A0ABV8K3U1_9BACL